MCMSDSTDASCSKHKTYSRFSHDVAYIYPNISTSQGTASYAKVPL